VWDGEAVGNQWGMSAYTHFGALKLVGGIGATPGTQTLQLVYYEKYW
jgi:hypothetical protein